MLRNGLASGNVFGISIVLYLSMILQDLTHVVDQADAWSEQLAPGFVTIGEPRSGARVGVNSLVGIPGGVPLSASCLCRCSRNR
jgi:hypothetical protein